MSPESEEFPKHVDRRQLAFLTKLNERTEDGSIHWALGDSSELEATVAGYLVRLFKSPTEYDEETFDYYVSVFDKEGNRVDTMADPDFAPIREEVNVFFMMRDTYARAARMAYGADRALDEMIAALSERTLSALSKVK